jgi:hypothetical protein
MTIDSLAHRAAVRNIGGTAERGGHSANFHKKD